MTLDNEGQREIILQALMNVPIQAVYPGLVVSIHAPRAGGDGTCRKHLHALQIACHKCDPNSIPKRIEFVQEYPQVSPYSQGI